MTERFPMSPSRGSSRLGNAARGLVRAGSPSIVAGLMVVGTVGSATAEGSTPAGVYYVPRSIDATGRQNVSGRLNHFIRSVPNGATIRFRAGGTYKLKGGGIRLYARRNLVIDGNGAKIKSFGCHTDNSPLKLQRTSGITVRNIILAGNNRRGGTRRAHRTGCESQPGVAIYESDDTVMERVRIRKTNGDCVYIGMGQATGRWIWSDGVVLRDSSCRRSGRHGVAIVGGRDILVERVKLAKIGMYVFDIEPNLRIGGAARVVFRNNKVGRYTTDADYHPYFFAANGHSGDDNIRDITVTGNRVTGGTLRSVSAVRTRRNITFTRNVSTVRAKGPVLYFRHIRGLTIKGNVQPLRSGRFASISQSYSVTYRR